jgi:hypothetical protein
MRQVLCNLDDIKRPRRLVENLIHLLETPASGFREEKVDGRHHGEVDDSEDDVGLVADVGESYGRNHYDHEVEGPVCGGGDCVCGCADGEGRDFCGVQPGHAEPANGEEGVEDEEENGLIIVSFVRDMG